MSTSSFRLLCLISASFLLSCGSGSDNEPDKYDENNNKIYERTSLDNCYLIVSEFSMDAGFSKLTFDADNRSVVMEPSGEFPAGTVQYTYAKADRPSQFSLEISSRHQDRSLHLIMRFEYDDGTWNNLRGKVVYSAVSHNGEPPRAAGSGLVVIYGK